MKKQAENRSKDETPMLKTGGKAEDPSTRAVETAGRERNIGSRGEYDHDVQDIDGGTSAQPRRGLSGGFEPGSDDLTIAESEGARSATSRTDSLVSNRTGMWDADASIEDQVGDREEASITPNAEKNAAKALKPER